MGLQQHLKKPDYTVTNIYETKGKSQSCNKPSDLCLTNLKLNEVKEVKEEGTKKHWKKGGSSIVNDSTLSLHISAYEDAIKASDSINDKNNQGLKKDNLTFTGSTLVIRNPFEFPRQQNYKIEDPELSKYKASQRLFNPNQASNNSQQKGNENVAAHIV
uniref:Uncharacterized protein n=1 Tax=Panagrolaimus sp. PS1159 TaxID=55785 RepID=A0AC35F5H7_9BILA